MNQSDFDPGPLAHVEHHVEGERSTLVFVRHFRHSPAKVWAALTDPARLRQWSPFEPDRDLATAGPAVLRMTDGHTTQEFPAIVRREAKKYGWEMLHDAYATKLGIVGKGWPEEVFPDA